MQSSKDVLLQLVRLGIGTSKVAKISKDIDWEVVEALAEKQGTLGVVYDGIISLADSAENAEILPLTVKLRWMGKVMQGYEQRYKLYRKTVEDLGAWYHAHGFRMMVLKGLACGVNRPKPEHRPYGDIDIWLFGKQKEADALLESVEFRELKERVLIDILEPEFTRSSPKKMIPRLMHKYRRWKGNEWKHKMCYNESMWSAFWSGVRLHLIKPASI